MRSIYWKIGLELASLELRCSRVIEGREIPRDRDELAIFGEELTHLARKDFNYWTKKEGILYNGCRYHVIVNVKQRGREVMGGFASAREIADVLKEAKKPEIFDEKAKNIQRFLGECRKEADYLCCSRSNGDDPMVAIYGTNNL